MTDSFRNDYGILKSTWIRLLWESKTGKYNKIFCRGKVRSVIFPVLSTVRWCCLAPLPPNTRVRFERTARVLTSLRRPLCCQRIYESARPGEQPARWYISRKLTLLPNSWVAFLRNLPPNSFLYDLKQTNYSRFNQKFNATYSSRLHKQDSNNTVSVVLPVKQFNWGVGLVVRGVTFEKGWVCSIYSS